MLDFLHIVNYIEAHSNFVAYFRHLVLKKTYIIRIMIIMIIILIIIIVTRPSVGSPLKVFKKKIYQNDYALIFLSIDLLHLLETECMAR